MRWRVIAGCYCSEAVLSRIEASTYNHRQHENATSTEADMRQGLRLETNLLNEWFPSILPTGFNPLEYAPPELTRPSS